MKLKDIIKLLDRRSELLDIKNNYGAVEIKAIDNILKNETDIPNEVYIKSFIGALDRFCKEEEECNLVEVKFIQDIRETYIVANGNSFKVHSNYPTEKMVDISFMWKKGVNSQMRYLMKKYPVLRCYMWKIIKKEIEYIKDNNLEQKPLSL